MTKVFGELPEGVLDIILEFASDGPLRLAFDVRRKKFVNKINNNFILLKKALQFKIDNPPDHEVDGWEWGDGEEEEEIDITDIGEDITETLIFKYPLRLRKVYIDDFSIDNGFLSVTFCYSRDFYTNQIKKCNISIPGHYLSLRSKAYNHYKEQMKKKISDKKKNRINILMKGFSSGCYADDCSEF